MINLFAKTLSKYAEEDRLTNAFMAVLQHSDPMVLNAILRLIDDNLTLTDNTADVEFALQVNFKGSRPDARMQTSDWDIVIEVKRPDPLNDSQFEEHWRNLQNATRRTILVSLTAAFSTPAIVNQLNEQNHNRQLSAQHLSWSKVLQTVCELRHEFEDHTTTGFLLQQFEGYLRHLGYYYIEGSILMNLKDYGEQLIALSEHEQRTKTQLHAHLKRLYGLIDDNLKTLTLKWSIKSWTGTNKSNANRANFDYLNADVSGFSNARYRVLPSLVHQGEPALHYYLTYSKEPEHWEAVVPWLQDHEEEIQASCGPLHRFGYLTHTNDKVFHINRQVAPKLAAQFFSSDDHAVQHLAQEMAHFFESVDRLLRKALEHTP